MKLYDIFSKPVNRTIEGVIKADDLAGLKTEIEEFVVTNEIEKNLSECLEAYNNYQGANGVWISGFFGCGKSHLLKMLALLIENRTVDGQDVCGSFVSKCSDVMLAGDIKRAASVPSTSILFNIDQKADQINVNEADAVLLVFVKVFNEMLGYFGKHPYVAEFERHLDGRGVYEEFKAAYQEISGQDWEAGREEIILEKTNVAKAYAHVSESSETSHENIVDAYRETYNLSIEDFAEQVNEYIQKQETGFRLNFFVDEVGQYIADNTKLMTNLQTIAESLSTKCGGQSWVVVTAQEDMDTVLGEMSQQQTSDFSKIQARFKTRMKLTSRNVDEVIQKRLLEKNLKGEQLAGELYQQESNNFGTLFDFSDGAKTYRNYKDRQHFVDCYPFIPYQFPLFQSSIGSLSRHGAFEGMHRSVGERSMLEVFQKVAVGISDRDVGQLASFDSMFEGVRATLKSEIQGSVLIAEKHLESNFPKRVLKALFLVKYIEDFNATARNLRVLLQDQFDSDIPTLRNNVLEALTLLEQQTYIKRNGDVYEYLTDEEKDIEQEIKTTDVDPGEVSAVLEKILFDEVVRDRKIRDDDTGQDFPFTRKIDDRIFGREQELTINFVSPFNENVENPELLVAHSLGRPELMVVLPADSRLVQDLYLYKRTEKYIRLNLTQGQPDAITMILNTKGSQNAERFKQIQVHARELITNASFYVSGTQIEVSGEDPKSRIVKGFHEVVSETYPNLRMLRGVKYSENDIGRYLAGTEGALLVDDLIEAEQEVLSFVKSGQQMGTRITMQSLEEKFSKRPYGWYLAAIQCIVAILAGRGKIEAKTDANILDDDDLERALTNTRGFRNIILDPQPDIAPEELHHLKQFYGTFFDRPPGATEAKALGNETRNALKELSGELKVLLAQSRQYPFLKLLCGPIETIDELTDKDYTYLFRGLGEQEDALLDLKEDVLDPVRGFMGGANKDIYDVAARFLQEQKANFGVIANGKSEQLREILDAADCFRGNQMKTGKTLMGELKGAIAKQLKEEKKTALQRIGQMQAQMQNMPDYADLAQEQKQEVDQSFSDFDRQIEDQSLIPVIRDRARRFETDDYNWLLTKISAWTGDEGANAVEYVSQRELDLKFDKAYLADKADVDSYLQALKKALLKAIKAKKRIQI
jgi:hypothetical protein